MQDTNNKNTIAKLGATLVALIMLLAILAVYLFPWAIPIFWDMPENTILPYYGLLMCIEMAPASWSLKNNAFAAKDNKGA
tara:strand:+ start:118 stop:357 length:240 start_codon:yes stop_codon:yes gene_type:complete